MKIEAAPQTLASGSPCICKFQENDTDPVMRLPRSLDNTINRYPELRPLLAEFCFSDPATAIHCALVHGFTAGLVDLYASSVNLEPERLKKLKGAADGVWLHDIGKALLVPGDPLASSEIINRVVGNNTGREDQNGDHIDERQEHDRLLHKIHPLLSGLVIRLLPKYFGIDEQLAGLWASVAFSHHEQFSRPGISVNNGGGRYTSYLREVERFNGDDPLLELVKLLTQVADTSVSIGFERIYRERRLPDELIFQILDESVISKERLMQLFGIMDEKQLLEVRKFIINNAFAILRKMQENYDAEKILRPMMILLGCELLKKPENNGLRNLIELSQAVWQNHEQRLMNEVTRK